MSDQGWTWRGVGAVVGAMVAALLATLAVGSSAWGQGGPIMYPEGERAGRSHVRRCRPGDEGHRVVGGG